MIFVSNGPSEAGYMILISLDKAIFAKRSPTVWITRAERSVGGYRERVSMITATRPLEAMNQSSFAYATPTTNRPFNDELVVSQVNEPSIC